MSRTRFLPWLGNLFSTAVKPFLPANKLSLAATKPILRTISTVPQHHVTQMAFKPLSSSSTALLTKKMSLPNPIAPSCYFSIYQNVLRKPTKNTEMILRAAPQHIKLMAAGVLQPRNFSSSAVDKTKLTELKEGLMGVINRSPAKQNMAYQEDLCELMSELEDCDDVQDVIDMINDRNRFGFSRTAVLCSALDIECVSISNADDISNLCDRFKDSYSNKSSVFPR